jgi:pyruvate dehydrogenase E2 component (dihydrolipoamide acetyltransferase)
MATLVAMPKLSDTMTEGVILKWRYKEGDNVKQGETLVEIESDKADMELEAYDSGILRKIFVPEGGKATIGAPIAVIGEANEDISKLLAQASTNPLPAKVEREVDGAPKGTTESPPSIATSPTFAAIDERIKASPLAKRIALDRRVDLHLMRGTGPNGRIIKRDVETDRAAISGAGPAFSAITPGTTKDIPLSPIRKTIAIRMAQSKQQVPHFYLSIEADMDPAISFREQLNTRSESKISFTDILIKACAAVLMRHPHVNATYQGDTMRQFGYAHIAIAVALDDGLVTPVLRNCEQKGIPQINAELKDLVERARNRKLKPDEYQGGTFTISNLGMFGVEEFSAIVNPPEGAILAVGAIVEKPVVKKGLIVIGRTMKLTLSSDHRIIDGAIAARFMQDLQNTMQNPMVLLL